MWEMISGLDLKYLLAALKILLDPSFIALVVETSATLCALAFTAGTILIRSVPLAPSDSHAEEWMEGFLVKAYSLGIDTNCYVTGTIHKRYVDEFVFHEFPYYGVSSYSPGATLTRPNFDLGSFLSKELGSSLYVDDKAQPLTTSKVITYEPIFARLLKLANVAPISVLTRLNRSARAHPALNRILFRLYQKSRQQYGYAKYTTLTYTLYPSKTTGSSTDFELASPWEWSYIDIKRFESKSSRINHFSKDLQFSLSWAYLLITRLPALIQTRNLLSNYLVNLSKEARNRERKLWHRTHEIRALYSELLHSYPRSQFSWTSLATLTLLFDAGAKNQFEAYLTGSDLKVTYETRRFANTMLRGAVIFGWAALAMLATYFVKSIWIALLAMVLFLLGWNRLLNGLINFREYFVIQKGFENIRFKPQFKCPTCDASIEKDAIICECGSRVSAKVIIQHRRSEPISPEQDIVSPIRWQKFVSSIMTQYEGMSIIKKAVKWRSATQTDLPNLKKIESLTLVGPEILVDVYSEGGESYTPPEILGLGEIVAIREEANLVSRLIESIETTIVLDGLSAAEIKQAIREMDLQPTVIFIPIKYFTMLFTTPPHGIKAFRDQNGEFLEIDSMRMRVFFSSVRVHFEKWILIDQRLGEWVVVSSPEGHWLTVERSSGRRERKFEVTIKLTANYLIGDSRKGLILDVREKG